ncbi:MAG: acyltransferase family protein [Oscillospiraceae bacterium]
MLKTIPQRKVYIDVLNIISCFGVVALHCSENVFYFSNSATWWTSMIIQTIARFPIPIFFMICGATLLNYRKKQTTADFFKRRFLRAVVPFIIWSFIYFIWGYIDGKVVFTGIRSFANYFLDNRILYIFWFFYSIIAIYLFIPVLSIITDHASKKLIVYLCGLCFLGTTILRAINIYTGFTVTTFFNIPMGSGYIGYVLLGYILSTYKIKKPYRLCLYASGVLSALTMIFGTYYFSSKIGSTDTKIMDYLSIACALISASVFVFIKNVDFEKITTSKSRKALSVLSSTSLGVYLMQMVVIILMNKYFVGLSSTLHYMLWAPILIYTLTVCVALIIKKIPIIKNILP